MCLSDAFPRFYWAVYYSIPGFKFALVQSQSHHWWKRIQSVRSTFGPRVIHESIAWLGCCNFEFDIQVVHRMSSNCHFRALGEAVVDTGVFRGFWPGGLDATLTSSPSDPVYLIWQYFRRLPPVYSSSFFRALKLPQIKKRRSSLFVWGCFHILHITCGFAIGRGARAPVRTNRRKYI